MDGLDLLLAQGNDAADALASQLDAYRVHLALAAVGQETGEFQVLCVPEDLSLTGHSWCAAQVTPPCSGFHEQFVRQIFKWFLVSGLLRRGVM